MRPIEHAQQEQKMITGPLAQRIQADDLNLSGNCRLSGNLLGGARRDRTADLLHAIYEVPRFPSCAGILAVPNLSVEWAFSLHRTFRYIP